MKPNIYKFIQVFVTAFIMFVLVISFLSCETNAPIERRTIKVVWEDSPDYLLDEQGKLSENGHLLFKEFNNSEAVNTKCKFTYILDPVLLRLDVSMEHSIITKIEKSFAASTGNSNRVIKLLQENLKNLIIPEDFLKNNKAKLNSDSLYRNFIGSLASEDSIIVFLENSKSDSVAIAGKQYKAIKTIEEVRNHLLSIMCQDKKAKIVLLVNPPIINIPIPESPGSQTVAGVKKGLGGSPTEAPPTPVVVPPIRRPRSIRVQQRIYGDLIKIAGTEQCDVCTLTYDATDNLGRIHKVLDPDPTFCCPCNKTIEMKGRTYRMDCSEGRSRLVLVQGNSN